MRRPIFAYILASLTLIACSSDAPPGTTFFDREIAPILKASCEGSTAPCHRDDGTGVALGNLDVTSFEAIQKRPDLLRRHGAYPQPLMLIKAVSSNGLSVGYGDRFFDLEVFHAGGPILQPSGDAFFTLAKWMENGATINGLPDQNNGQAVTGACTEAMPKGVDPTTVTDSDPGFADFDTVQTYLVEQCGAGSCHGNTRTDFRLTCGTEDLQKKANYLMSRAYIATAVDDSPLMRKALDPSSGGESHRGGIFFANRDDADFVRLYDWAKTAGPMDVGTQSAGKEFFDTNVMPILLKRGCAFEACHSDVVPFKVNLRAGAEGFFSPIAKNINYGEVKKFLGLASPNPLASRIVAKNIIGSKGGITHRGGPVLETPGAPNDPFNCATPFDVATATPLCTIQEWRRLERADLPGQYRADLSDGATLPLVYVQRPPDSVRVVDFALFRPGADLIRSSALMGPDALLSSISGQTSMLDTCPNIASSDRSQVDVRAPEASFDATRIVFAMRVGAADGLNLYEVDADGSNCRQLTSDGGQVVNGLPVHNFDPFYYWDSNTSTEWVVYASSRGGPEGPVRTPKLFLVASDMWRQPTAGGEPERLTFMRGAEVQPFLMNNGMTAVIVEKSSADYYQFSARRLNWDRSDYHPLLGQRKASFVGRNGYAPGTIPDDAVPVQSLGYSQVTEVRNVFNGDFVVVLADTGAYGEGGALGLFNRSLGPFEMGRDEPSFAKSLTIMPGASGRHGDASGAYRSPHPLPDSSILASYAANADIGDSATAKRYELVVVDRITGERRTLRSDGQSLVEAILVMARPYPKPFIRAPSTLADATADHAVLHYIDLPLIATLQGANDRRGRSIETLRSATHVRYFTRGSPPSTCATPADCAAQLVGTEQVYESRVDVGSAPLSADGSVFIRVPANLPLSLELLDANGNVLYQMQEDTQFGPFENINLAVPEPAFHTLCGSCHGSITGRDLDISIDVDAITTASQSTARLDGIRDLQ